MEQINKSKNHLFYLFSIGSLALMSLMISSCGSDSSSSTTTKKGSWDRKAQFSELPRNNAAGFVIDGKAYVVGGYNYKFNNRQSDMLLYDPSIDTWVKKASFPGIARSQAVAIVINGKAYVGLGTDGVNLLKDFYEYSPATDQWIKVADFIDARTGCIAFSVNNRGFVGAGDNGSGKSDLWEYLPSSNTWVQRASLGSKRNKAIAFVVDNSVYVLGGTDNTIYVPTVEKYTPNSDAGIWERKASLTQRDKNGNAIVQPTSRELSTAFAIDGFGYVTAGTYGSILKDTWQYNPSNDTWIQYHDLDNFQAARDGAVAFSIGKFGYLVTGRNGGSSLDDLWVFDPLGDEGTNGNGL